MTIDSHRAKGSVAADEVANSSHPVRKIVHAIIRATRMKGTRLSAAPDEQREGASYSFLLASTSHEHEAFVTRQLKSIDLDYLC